MISSMISEGPRDSSYEEANTHSENFEDISASQKSDYVRVSDSHKSKDNLGYDLSTSQKSDSYISVSECDDRKNDMESEQEQPEYCEPTDIHMEEDKRLDTSSYQRGENTGNKRPMQIVPPTMLYMENTDTYQRIGDIEPCGEPNEGDIMRQYGHVKVAHKDETERNIRCCKVCGVMGIIIIIGLVTAVGVLVYIVLEKNSDERESTANEVKTTPGRKTSVTPVATTTLPVQFTSTSSNPLTSTVKVPGYPKDCKEIRDLNINITTVYTIYPYSRSQAVNVMCDMSRDNEGWTVFQRRFDGSVDFYRVWKSYKNGFGSVTGEHWLGNDILHQLTALGESFLYVVLEDFDGKEYVAEYSNFTISDESDQYRFWISEFMGGNAKNAIEGWEVSNVNGMQFSTYDRDNDNAISSCAVARHGAWWYNECTMTNLNGRYPVDGGVCGDCNFWFRIFENFNGLKKTMMMVRRK